MVLQYFQSLRDRIVSLQLPDTQQSMASSFEALMKDVGRNLSAKNRDKYANIFSTRSQVVNIV